ncbi:type II toxin-antitoxin system HipA family toxin [Pelagibius sp. 7325]|uniref:type II toxin-antitoxin system HipA family toxin n=1 Tax=Pelagibius sp. 7325 TaxID=3131994 RepID=UPI0030EBD6AE
MLSDRYSRGFVWIWLPCAKEPVVAGELTGAGPATSFRYAESYLNHENAISIYSPDLPLRAETLTAPGDQQLPGPIRDAGPDAWGRHVIRSGFSANCERPPESGHETVEPDDLTYLMESGSDRIGALDFQRSASCYDPRVAEDAELEIVIEAAEIVDQGGPLSPALLRSLLYRTAVGGARPKALVELQGSKYVAKFPRNRDRYPIVRAEFAAMRLASLAGLDVAPVILLSITGKDVLLVERFDRREVAGGWERRSLVSALTILGLDEMLARYASYETLADVIRERFTKPEATLRELFGRLVFNVLIGNTDDHARNHAAFWDGCTLTLTPAYDICPQPRTGNEASQAMLIAGDNRLSRVSTCLAAAKGFLLTEAAAISIVERQIQQIALSWATVAEEAGLSSTECQQMLGRQVLNPFAFQDLSRAASRLATLADDARGTNA